MDNPSRIATTGPVPCQHCQGTGSVDTVGPVRHARQLSPEYESLECDECQGLGLLDELACHDCERLISLATEQFWWDELEKVWCFDCA